MSTRKNAKDRNKAKRILFRRHGDHCAWCSTQLTLRTATLDHVRTRRAGGSNWPGNLLLSCLDCNHQRQNADAREWLEVCLKEGKRVELKLVEGAIQRSLTWRASDLIWSRHETIRHQRNRKRNLIAAGKLSPAPTLFTTRIG